MPRKYWLTFQGTVNYGGAYERRALLIPLAKQSTASRPVLIAAKCRKGDDGTYAESADISPAQCAELDWAPREKYLSTLNTTFALVPGGMQPASFRLDEVCAAGAIPVFVSGDLVTQKASMCALLMR
jgi:glucuronyl/N-acetylglucosaminyl transferase EXT1